MKIRSILALVAGSITVHLAVACGSQAVDAVGEGHDSGVFDAIVDVIADVPSAEAAPDGGGSGPVVTSATCSKMATASGVTVWLAEVAYPGRSMTGLANVRAIVCFNDTTLYPSGYSCANTGVSLFVRDGFVAYNCGNDPSKVKTVSFVD